MHAQDENDAPRICVCCGAEANDVDRRGEFVSAGYGSKHDAQTYAVLDTSAVPEGFLCDACVDGFVEAGHLVHVYSFGQMQKDLPAAAYAVIFRSGQSHMAKLLAVLAAAPGPDGVQTLLRKAVDFRVREPFTAGMITALLGALGHDTGRADEAYAGDLAGTESDIREMFDQMLAEMDAEEELGKA